MLLLDDTKNDSYDKRMTTAQGSEIVPFQRWFKFKEAFSAELVHRLIEELPVRPNHILDCFGGSGTTGLVANKLGIRATLIEVNPFLTDLITAKLSPCSSADLTMCVERVLRYAYKTIINLDELRARLPITFIAPGKKGRFIFNEDVARAIEEIRISIERLRNENAKRLLKIALGSCLIAVSNVRIDGKGRRYRSGWQNRKTSSADVYALFVDATTAMAVDLIHTPVEDFGFQLLRGDTRELVNQVDASIDFALFSPPYPNSFDYTDVYNIELWMLGYFGTYKDNAVLRQSTLRSHVQCSWKPAVRTISSISLDKTLAELDRAKDLLWDDRIPDMILGYFEDLVKIIETIGKKLTADGRISIVVGNSLYAGILIDVPTILSEALTSKGLETVSSQSVRSMRTSIQQRTLSQGLSESLVTFKLSRQPRPS